MAAAKKVHHKRGRLKRLLNRAFQGLGAMPGGHSKKERTKAGQAHAIHHPKQKKPVVSGGAKLVDEGSLGVFVDARGHLIPVEQEPVSGKKFFKGEERRKDGSVERVEFRELSHPITGKQKEQLENALKALHAVRVPVFESKIFRGSKGKWFEVYHPKKGHKAFERVTTIEKLDSLDERMAAVKVVARIASAGFSPAVAKIEVARENNSLQVVVHPESSFISQKVSPQAAAEGLKIALQRLSRTPYESIEFRKIAWIEAEKSYELRKHLSSPYNLEFEKYRLDRLMERGREKKWDFE
jgi:hypothetical protein